jgi:A/G-specific adenine glycosylase
MVQVNPMYQTNTTEPVKIREQAHTLVLWYQHHHRNMPWRETLDPYSIWVSETMLQQTRVETVIPYYHQFMESFPTVRELAAADEQTVLKHWQGLGYYSRARNLHRAAQQVVSLHGGRIPEKLEDFRALPGVGPYTAGAVFSIAYNQPVPAVDGNVLRVVTRFLGIFHPIETAAARQAVTAHVAKWLQEEQPRYLTQALMELGATVCVPKSAKCSECPLADTCFARAENVVEQLPVRKQKADRKCIDVVALWWEADGKLWMEQRPDSGLLAGMWQLPAWEVGAAGHDDLALERALKERFAEWVYRLHAERAPAGDDLPSFAKIAHEKHVFTHLEWDVHVFRPIFTERGLPVPEPDHRRPVPLNEVHTLPLPRVYEKLLQQIYG